MFKNVCLTKKRTFLYKTRCYLYIIPHVHDSKYIDTIKQFIQLIHESPETMFDKRSILI